METVEVHAWPSSTGLKATSQTPIDPKSGPKKTFIPERASKNHRSSTYLVQIQARNLLPRPAAEKQQPIEKRHKTSHQPETAFPQESHPSPSRPTKPFYLPTPPSSPTHPELVAACKIAYCGRKGFGLKSTRNIAKGEVIISEKPFVTFDIPLTTSQVHQHFNALTPDQRILFLSFQATCIDVEDVLVKVADSNVIDCWNSEDAPSDTDPDCTIKSESGVDGGDVEKGIAGLFEYICRINHSCTPNSAWSWDPSTSSMLLIALIDISERKELTAGYCGNALLESRQARNDILELQFGRECMCKACNRSDRAIAASDSRLTRIKKTQDRFTADHLAFAFDRGRALVELDWVERALKEEKKYGQLGIVPEERMIVHAMWAERPAAKKAAKTAVAYNKMVMGEERAAKLDMNEWARYPEHHWSWGEALDANGRKMSTSDDGSPDFGDHYSHKNSSFKRARRSRTNIDKTNAADHKCRSKRLETFRRAGK